MELLQRRLRGLLLWDGRPRTPAGVTTASSSSAAGGSSENTSVEPDSTAPVDQPTSFLTGAVEDILIEVLLERWIQAANSQRTYQQQNPEAPVPTDLKDIFNWWSFTLRYAEQFYAIVNARMIDLKRFFVALRARRLLLWRDDASLLRGIAVQPETNEDPQISPELLRNGATPMPFIDNAIIYGFLQVSCVEEPRKMFMLDCSSTENGGPQASVTSKDTLDFSSGLMEILESFYNPAYATSDAYGRFSLRDDSFWALQGKLKQQSLSRDSTPIKMREDVMSKFEKLVSRPAVDLATLASADAELFCLQSSYDFRAPAIAVRLFTISNFLFYDVL